MAAPDEVEGPCIGGDYCGRVTNGWFSSGSHGPGWYCGWCEAIPDGRPDPSAPEEGSVIADYGAAISNCRCADCVELAADTAGGGA